LISLSGLIRVTLTVAPLGFRKTELPSVNAAAIENHA
jgi:hypothetical protein